MGGGGGGGEEREQSVVTFTKFPDMISFLHFANIYLTQLAVRWTFLFYF